MCLCATTATSKRCAPEHTLVLFGSPHPNGATAQLLKAYLDGDEPAMQVDCYARAVIPCDDCRGCYQAARCVKPDMEDIYDALEAADRLIIATPVYNRSFPAPLKAVLDRLQCYWAARFIRGVKPPIAQAKQVVLLTACGSDRPDGQQLETQLAPLLTVINGSMAHIQHLRDCDKGVDGTQIL